MKQVTAFIGTESRKATFLAVQEFEKNLKQKGDIDFKYIFLQDYHLDFCRGCKSCFLKGEEFCPSKDDRDVLLEVMDHSDGVIFASPTYSFQISARMKNFIDRLSFICHRPRFFNKTFTAVVVRGFPFGNDALKYLSFWGKSVGFHVSKGCCLTTLDPLTQRQKQTLVREVKKSSDRFYQALQKPATQPSFIELMVFRIGRTSIMKSLDMTFRDYQYYKKKGWFKADFYYPVSLGLIKRIMGNIFDFLGRQLVKIQ